MADSKKSSHRYCVAGGPNKQSCKNSSNSKDVSFHKFPNDYRRIAWIRFVQRHRPAWQPSQSSVLCSSHFTPESYEKRLDITLEMDVNSKTKPWLSKTAVPSIDIVNKSSSTTLNTTTAREKRQVSFRLFVDFLTFKDEFIAPVI